MEFAKQRAIYLQIGDWLCDKILGGEYGVGTRLPSVRECAAMTEVNVNTVARTYEWLQQQDVVAVRRGMGYYVADGARERIIAMKRDTFFTEQLPQVFATMRALDIPLSDVAEEYRQYESRLFTTLFAAE